MNQNNHRIHVVLALFVILSLLGGSCQLFARSTETPAATVAAATAPAAVEPAQPTRVSPTLTQAAQAEATAPAEHPGRVVGAVPAFAAFQEPEISKKAVLQPYTVEADLSNVVNPFVLSKAQMERLAKDGIVVSPGNEKEFFTVYEKARYANVPIFVTSDFAAALVPPAL